MLSQKYKNYRVITKFNNQLPQVRLDEEKFQQIITNLLDNACKYSEVEKPIIISTSFADSEHVMIKIKDEGVGIKPEDLEKVFVNKYERVVKFTLVINILGYNKPYKLLTRPVTSALTHLNICEIDFNLVL